MELRIVAGFLIALGAVSVVMVVLVVLAISRALDGGFSEARQSQQNADLLFSAFTGQAPSARVHEGGSDGSSAHAIGPLAGQPTPREEIARATAAFAATGYTPTADNASGEPRCSIDSYPSNGYPSGAAPSTVRVTCAWIAHRLSDSTATVAIEADVRTADLHTTSDGRGYLTPDVALLVDLRLADGTVDVSASK